MKTRLLCAVVLFFLTLSGRTESPGTAGEAKGQFASADAELNKVYQELLKKVDEPSQKKLRESQRAWLAYRDAEAAFVVASSGGTISRITYWVSMSETTRQRITQLKDDFP